jgi:hypothetical protein
MNEILNEVEDMTGVTQRIPITSPIDVFANMK